MKSKGMTKQEAFELIYKYNSIFTRTVDRLMAIHPEMNAVDVARTCGIQLGNVYQMMRKYRIKLASRRDQNSREARYEWYNNQIVKNWNKNETIRQNAVRIGISEQLAGKISREFNLSDNKMHLKETTIRHIKRIKSYVKKGLTHAEIARILGMTRERVRQLDIIKGY